MPSRPSRRSVLRIGIGSAVAVLGGCLDSTSNRSASSPEPTGVTPRPPDEPRTDDLYLHNEDGDEYLVTLRLVRTDGESDETVLEKRYRLASAFRLRIPNVGDQGATYAVSAAIDDEGLETWTWDVRTCVGTEAPRGNRDAEVRIEDGAAAFVKNACDAIFVGSRPASNHEAYIVKSDGKTIDGETTDS